MKILLNILIFFGLTNAYAGTSELIIKECRETSSEGGGGDRCADGPVSSCHGCLKC